MSVRAHAFVSRPAALVSLSATLILAITLILTGCGASNTATEWTWVNNTAGTNLAEANYNWTASATAPAQEYASSRTTEQNRFWEFSAPATELWSWVSGSSTQNKIYLASMSELNSTANSWEWVSGSAGMGGNFGTQGLAAIGNVPGARCVDWVEAGDPMAVCGDELQANLKDYYRYGP